MMFAYLVRGELIAVPSVETAEEWARGQAPPTRNRRSVLGDPFEVQNELLAVRDIYDAQELMLVNIMPDHSARVRSYELIAEQFALSRFPLAKQPELA
jgi:hypothetical protein